MTIFNTVPFKKSLSVFVLPATLMATSGQVAAQGESEEKPYFDLTAHVELVSDYRLRGVSLTNINPTIQGGFDIAKGNFYAGTWASGLDEDFAGANTEIDLYAGYVFNLGKTVTLDVGAIGYLYAGGGGLNYFELYGNVGFATGPVSWSASAWYGPDQANLGSGDNIFLSLDAEYPIGDTNWSLTGHLGYEDGFFGNDKIDWNLGIATTFQGLDLSVKYVDTDQGFREAKAGVVFSVGVSF